MSASGKAPYVYVTIEGYGTAGQCYRWTSRKSVGSLPIHRPYLRSWPAQVSEVMNVLGGVSESGELTVSLVDIGNFLTPLFAMFQRATTYLAAAAARGATSLVFASNTGLVDGAGQQIFVGNEAFLLLSISSGTTWDVTPASLETDAARHGRGDPVLLASPNVLGRRMRFYLGFGSESAIEIGGGWAVDKVRFEDSLNTWTLVGRSQLKYVDRILDRKPYLARVQGYVDGAHRTLPVSQAVSGFIRHQFYDVEFYLVGDESDGEIVALDVDRVIDHGVAGTRPKDWVPDDPIRQVWAAWGDRGSFRYQEPGAETSTPLDPAEWTASAGAPNILLGLATSSSDLADPSPTSNYVAGKGNYSCLPGGVGIGVRAADLDFDSFLDVWFRHQDVILEDFVLAKSEPARAVFDRILRLTGWDLTTIDGLLSLNAQRLPLEDEIGPLWDRDVLLVERGDGEGHYRPKGEVELDSSVTAGAVVFTARSAGGADVEIVYTSADFPETFGNVAGLYEIDEKRLAIDARYIRVDDSGAEPEWLRQRALKLLYCFHRPLQRLTLFTNLEQREVQHGELVRITHPQIRDLYTGTVGVVGLVCRVVEKKISVPTGEIEWVLYALPGGRQGRITPTARITSVATNTATVAANRYTDPAARGDLPASDAAGFAVGDRVQLRTRGGEVIATTPTYQTVSSLGTNALTLDGDFGASVYFAAGTLIEWVSRGDQVAAQYGAGVAFADELNRTVGGSTQTPWTVGEP